MINLTDKIKKITEELADKLATKALETAQANFNNAEYAGDNDVTVTREDISKTEKKIVADGNATLFIEFGAGVRYPDSHPEAGKLGVKHGTYGLGRGASPKGWRYRGSKGNAPDTKVTKSGLVHTYGNKANLCMYNAREAAKELVK